MSDRRRPFQDQLRQAVRDHLAATGITQNALAREIGLDQAILSRFLRRKSGLSMATIDDLTRLFDLDLTPRDRSK